MVKYMLNTKPTQFTKGKTEETLCRITKRYIRKLKDEDEHVLEIIVTNNSLPETEQWKYRTNNNFKNIENITIDILSSKSKDYKNINDYICDILSCNNKKELPNILIVCFHSQRVCKDIIKLLKIFSNIRETNGKYKIKFHISFDEPDANIGRVQKFFKLSNDYLNDTVESILFITATPEEKFWKVLSKNNIHKLLNIKFNDIYTFEDDIKEYMSFKEHNITIFPNITNNPLHYITSLFVNNIINKNERKIIFAPAHLHRNTENVGSHKEVKNFFLNMSYHVLLMNGTFKGFIKPNEEEITIKEFNKKHNIKGELRDTLRKWNEINPNCNLAITGYWVVERGITFNTDGFNFTDVILSNYHVSCDNRLIQIAGRATGNKKYVKKMNIFCTKEINKKVLEFNEKLEQVCSINPQYFNKTDFTNNNSSIPVKVTFDDDNFYNMIIQIRIKHKKDYKIDLHKLLISGIEEGKIILEDRNNINTFNIHERELKDVRMYKKGQKIDARRFKQFNNSFDTYTSGGQSGHINEYNIDLAKDDYIDGDFINKKNVGWITYRIK